jgi:hypothetical protein
LPRAKSTVSTCWRGPWKMCSANHMAASQCSAPIGRMTKGEIIAPGAQRQ